MQRRYIVLSAVAAAVIAVAVILTGPRRGDPPSAAQLLSPSQLRSDFDSLHALIAEGVPTYGVFRDRATLDARFAEARAQLNRPMTAAEFWKIATPAVVAVGDGHLSLSPNRSAFADSPFDRMLPLSVRFVGERLIVRRNLSDADIPIGSEILSVNAMAPARIVAACAPYVSRLPEIRTRLMQKVARELSERCGMASGMTAPYRLFYLPPASAGAAARAITLDGIRHADFSAIYLEKYPNEPEQKPLELILGQSYTAVLKVRTFQDREGFDFAEEIVAAIARIRAAGTTSLILDLRENPGGPDSAGALLFSLLTDKPFRYLHRRDLGRGFRKVIWKSSDRPLVVMELLVSKRRNESGGYRLYDAIDGVQEPHSAPFTGKLFTLIDGTSFSTSANLATVIKHRRRGLLIGEESGSGYREDSGGTFDVTLPHSGLVAALPIVRYRMIDGHGDGGLRGVIPDILHEPTVDDVIGRTDSMLDRALMLAARSAVRPTKPSVP